MRFNLNKSLLLDTAIFFFLLGLTLYICRFFLSSQLIEGHDGSGAFVKVLAMVDMIKGHQWDFSWQSNLYLGHGYPLFTFYPPLFYIIASFFVFMFKDIILGLNAAVVCVYFLSGVAMYFCAREFWGRAGAFLSAVAYLTVPYHILNLYVRNAYAEMTSFIFLPIILWCLYKITISTRKRYCAGAIFSVAALILTHVLMSMIFIPIACLWGIMLIVFTKEKKIGLKVILVVMLGAGVTAFFWLPLLILKPLVNTDTLIQGFNYKDHFIAWWQMIKPSWGFGDRVSFQLGWAHLLLFILGMISLGRNKWNVSRKYVVFIVMIVLIVCGSIFMCLPYSQHIWERLPPLHFMQFPWRFLALASFGICFILGGVCHRDNVRSWLMAVIGVIFVCLINFAYCYSPNIRPFSVSSANDLTSQIRSLDMNEYVPRVVKQLPQFIPVQKIEFMHHQGATDISGPSLLHRTFRIEPIVNEDVAVFHGFYFPGWKVTIDGKNQEITPVRNSGLIAFVVPKDSRVIEVWYSMTRLRFWSMCISIILFMSILLRFMCMQIRMIKGV